MSVFVWKFLSWDLKASVEGNCTYWFWTFPGTSNCAQSWLPTTFLVVAWVSGTVILAAGHPCTLKKSSCGNERLKSLKTFCCQLSNAQTYWYALLMLQLVFTYRFLLSSSKVWNRIISRPLCISFQHRYLLHQISLHCSIFRYPNIDCENKPNSGTVSHG